MYSPSRNRPRFPRQSRGAPRWGAFLLLFALMVVVGLFVWRCTSSSPLTPDQTEGAVQRSGNQTSVRQTPAAHPPVSLAGPEAQASSDNSRTNSGPNFVLSTRNSRKEGAIPILVETVKKELPTISRIKAKAATLSAKPETTTQPASLPSPKQGAILLLTDTTYKELPRIAAQLEAQARPSLKAGAVLVLIQRTNTTKQSLAAHAASSRAEAPSVQQLAEPDTSTATPATKTGAVELFIALVAAEQLPARIAVLRTPQTQPKPDTVSPATSLPTQSAANAAPLSPSTASLAPNPAFSPSHIAAVDNPWGLPFVGFPIEEIAQALSERYSGRQPKLWGEHLPGVISKLNPKAYTGSAPVVALTLDACDGKANSSYDADIIAFLQERKIPATIFVTSKWMQKNRKTFAELAKNPLFEIAAHGVAHKPCSVNGKSAYGIKGTASMLELVAEVEINIRDIQRTTSTRPAWFRSGTAFYDDVAISVIHDLGIGVAGYSIAADEGASLPAAAVAKKILSAQHTDILLLHLNHPRSGTREGLRQALPLLQEKGYRFVTLSGS